VKIAIDTNLWISYLIGKRVSGLKDICTDENISVFYCDEIIAEFIRMHCIKATFKNFEGYTLRDPKDTYLLALTDAVNANFLLTGDKDLLVLEKHNITRIISYSDFMGMHYGQQEP
jgi:predicted nucleic acid-binding protein